MVLFGKIPFMIFIVLMIGLISLSIPSNNRMGMILYDSYRYDEAFEYLKTSNVKEGKQNQNLTAFKKLKDFYLLKGDVPRALEFQKKLVETKPRNVEFLLELEKLYGWNIQPLQQLFTREKRAALIEDKTERINLLYEIAQGYRWLRDYENTNRVFKMIEDDVDINQNINIINYYLNSKQTQKVIARINKSLKQGIVDLKFLRILSQVYEYENQTAAAIETQILILKKLLVIESTDNSVEVIADRISPKWIKNAFPELERLLLLYIANDQENSAKKLATVLSENLDENYELMFDLAEVLFEKGYVDLAKANYEKIQKGVKKDQKYYLFEIAGRFRELGENDRTLQIYKRLDRMYPFDVIILESFADFYEDIGEKRKALNLYYRILKIDKTSIRGVFIQQVGLPVAQADYMKANYLEILKREMIRPSKYQISKSRIRFGRKRVKLRIKRVKIKIINLLEDLGEKDKLLAAYNDLLKDDPNNLSILKRKAYLLQELGKTSEAEKLFVKIYDIDPKDTDAILIKAQFLITEGELDESIELLEGLKSKNRGGDYVDSLLEEAYYTSDEEKHAKHCQEIKSDNNSNMSFIFLKSRCIYRTENAGKARQYLSRYKKKYSNQASFLTNRLDFELLVGDIEESQKIIDKLKLSKKFNANNKRQERVLEQLIKQRDFENSFVLNYKADYFTLSNFDYFRSGIDVSKRIRPLRFGAEVTRVDFLKTDVDSFRLPSVYLMMEGDDYYAKISNTFDDGDRFNKSGIGTDVLKTVARNGSFIYLSYKTLRPDHETNEQARDRANSTVLEFYSEFYYKRSTFIPFLNINDHRVQSLEGDSKTFGLTYDYRLGRNWSTGAVNSNTKMNGPAALDLYYIRNSFYYGLLLQRLDVFEKGVKTRVRVDLGGDSKRNIGFGKSYSFLAELTKQMDVGKDLVLRYRYANETLGSLGNSSNRLTFNFNYWF